MPKLRREPEGGDAVDDAEVDRLGAAPHVRVHAFDRHAEHLGRGHRVDVEPVLERFHELRDVGHVREHAELDLAVVGGDELVPLVGDEGAADRAAFLGADRDVLQVRLGGGEPAGRGRGERVVGVDAAGLRVDVAGDRVGVGGLQLRELPPVDDLSRDRHALVGELFEHLHVGRPLAGRGLLAAGARPILPNRISPSCLVEPMLNSWPASS